MKKLIGLSLCLVMVAGMAGCAPKEEAAPAAAETTTAATTETDSDSYPSRDISYIVPYTAGGGTDALMRIVNNELEKELGTSIIISNVTGGGGQVGITQLSGMSGDGYSMGAMTDTDHYVTLLAGENVSYDLDSFKYVASVNTSCDVIIVNKDTGIETMEDFIAMAQEKPGEITVGASGQVHVLDAGMLSQATDIKLTTIMHDGATESLSACLGGQIDAVIIDKKFVAQVEGQDVNVLASFGAERLDAIADIPTLTELGYDVASSMCRLIMVPSDTPDDIVYKLSDAIEKATDNAEFIESMEAMSEVYKFVGHDELEEQVDRDYAAIKAVLDANPDILN